MSVLLLSVGTLLLLTPSVLRGVGRIVSPSAWARWCLHAVWLGIVTLTFGLATTSIPTVLRAAGVPALAKACEHALAPLQPAGTIGGWIAAGGALWLAGASLVGWRRARRAQRRGFVEPLIGDHDDRFGVDIVVLTSAEPLAYSVSARTAQIVLTTGLVAGLEPDQLDVVLRHELAHLHRHHQRYMTVAVAAETALGRLARFVTGELRLAIERVADEDAASADPRRRRSLRAALLVSAVQPRAGLATLSPSALVAERIHALGIAPARPRLSTRLALHAPAAVVTVAGLGTLSVWVEHISHVIAMAGRCAR